MTSLATHIIRKQNVHLRVAREGNALALQQRFLRMMEEQVLPALESAFDRLIHTDEWIEIDRLEIDLGHLDPHESEQIWAQKTVQAYLKALEKQLPKEGTRRNRAHTKKNELLLYFLQYGVLPWWAFEQRLEGVFSRHFFDVPNQQRSIELYLEHIVKDQAPILAPQLLKWLQSKPLLQRWVRRFDDEIQFQVFEWVAKQRFSAISLPITLKIWMDCLPEVPAKTLRNIYWESLWITLSKGTGDFVQNWLKLLFDQGLLHLPEDLALRLNIIEKGFNASFYRTWPNSVQVLWQQAAQTLFQKDFARLARQEKKGMARRIEAFVKRHIQKFPAEKVQWSPLIEAIHFPLDQTPNLSPPEPEVFTGDESQTLHLWAAEPDGVFVPLAGIVLIHPFLPAFFEQLGLLQADQFIDPMAQERALHVLYHLATGLQHPREEELPLLKLLCGLAIETPVELELDLSEQEQQETLNLLQVLSVHWKDLQGMEPEDLRGSFFVREGKLRKGDMGLYLSVEEKTWDILLTKLPWGLSPILHSWMSEMIWVEWV